MNKRFLSIMLSILLVLTQMPLSFAVKYKTATVVDISGAVSILKAGGEKAITPILNMELEHGDRIITGKNSSISLQIEGDQYIKVGEKTYMSLSELMSEAESGGDSTNIKLFTGKVWATISKPLAGDDTFEIETPTAVMGAKGTKFLVKYAIPNTSPNQEHSDTELVVLEGTVKLKTKVEGQFHNDTPLETQDVEILVGVNESLLLDQRLVQGISDRIQSLIESGQTLESLNIQEVVKEVANVQKIKVENLDLFMLEIIADEPQGFDPALSEGIDQLIEQRRNELPPEEGGTGLEDILGGAAGTFDGSGIRYDNGATGPISAPPPQSFRDNRDDKTGGSGGNVPPVNPPTGVSLQITQVKTLDLVDNDGISDHIKITFNKAVKDATYSSTSGITFSTSGSMVNVFSSGLAYTAIPNEVNQSNDASIVLALDTAGRVANTMETGFISIPNAGMISANDGSRLATVSNFALTDGVAPILSQVTTTRQGDAVDKRLMLIFSEPIKPLSTNYLTSGVSISNNSSATFQTAVPLNAMEADVALQGSTITVENLSLDIVNQLNTGAKLFTNSESSFILEDAFGNQRQYSNKSVTISLTDSDTIPARITGVQLTTINSDAYMYDLKLMFSDYIADQTVIPIVTNYEELLYRQNGTQDTTTASSITVFQTKPSNIGVSYTLDLDAPLDPLDVFDLTFSVPWYDLQGQTVRNDINVVVPSLYIVNVAGDWVIYHGSEEVLVATSAVADYEALLPLGSPGSIDTAIDDYQGSGGHMRTKAVNALAAISNSNPTEHTALAARVNAVDTLIQSKVALITNIVQMAVNKDASTLVESNLTNLGISYTASNLEAYKNLMISTTSSDLNSATKIATFISNVDTQVASGLASDAINVSVAKTAVGNYEALLPLDSMDAIDVAIEDYQGNGEQMRIAAVDALAVISDSNPIEHTALTARLNTVDALIQSKVDIITNIVQMATDQDASTLVEANLVDLGISYTAANLEAYKALIEVATPADLNTATKIAAFISDVDTQVAASSVSGVINVSIATTAVGNYEALLPLDSMDAIDVAIEDYQGNGEQMRIAAVDALAGISNSNPAEHTTLTARFDTVDALIQSKVDIITNIVQMATDQDASTLVEANLTDLAISYTAANLEAYKALIAIATPADLNTATKIAAFISAVDTSPLAVIQVKTLDLVDDDGICDHIKITFNKAVNDATYNTNSGITLDTNGSMGSVIPDALAYTAIPNEVNQSGDMSIVLALDTVEKLPYTMADGFLSIQNSGMISAVDGSLLGAVPSFDLTDGIAPVLSQVTANLQADAMNKRMTLIFSEPIEPLDASYLTSGVSISNNESDTFQSSVLLNAVEGDTAYQGSEIIVENLSYGIITQLDTGAKLYTNSESSFMLEDAFGNQRQYSNQVIDISLLDSDTFPARITGVELITLDSDAYVYSLNILLSDYLSVATQTQILTAYSQDSEFFCTQIGNQMIKTPTSISMVQTDAYNIYVTYQMDLDAPLDYMDVFDLSFSTPWLDLQGQTVRDDTNMDVESLHIVNEYDSWIIYHEDNNVSIATAAVGDYESLLPLGNSSSIDIAIEDFKGGGDHLRESAVDALAAISDSNPSEHDALQVRIDDVDSFIQSKLDLIESIKMMAIEHSASTLTETNLADLGISYIAANLEAYKAAIESVYSLNIDTATKIETLIGSVDAMVTASTVLDVIKIYNAKNDLTTLTFSTDISNTAIDTNPIIVAPTDHFNGATYVFPPFAMLPTEMGGAAYVDGSGNLLMTRDTISPFNFNLIVSITSNQAVTTSTFSITVPPGTAPVTYTLRRDLE